MEENEIQVRERISVVESSLKSLHKRVDHIEELVESVQKMTVELQHMREDINKVADKVDVIEKQPTKMWNKFIVAILSALGGGIASFFIQQLVK